jgi:hypothetical protein
VQEALSEQRDAGPAIALALEELQTGDLPFDGPVAPLQGEPGFHRDQVILQPPREPRMED